MIVASSNMQRNPPVSVSCVDIPCTIDQRPDTLLQVKGISFKLEKSIFWTRQTNKNICLVQQGKKISQSAKHRCIFLFTDPGKPLFFAVPKEKSDFVYLICFLDNHVKKSWPWRQCFCSVNLDSIIECIINKKVVCLIEK